MHVLWVQQRYASTSPGDILTPDMSIEVHHDNEVMILCARTALRTAKQDSEQLSAKVYTDMSLKIRSRRLCPAFHNAHGCTS